MARALSQPLLSAAPAAPEAGNLLAWYDRHRRVLPWRAAKGQAADPYAVWLSEIMLQQTTVQAVKSYFERFLAAFPTVEALAQAPTDSVMKLWAGLGYYSRARNLHACAKEVVARFGGEFPADEALLRTLPGIGAYTAAAIAAIAFDIPATVVDGNVERVVSRLFAIAEPLPNAKPMIRLAAAALTPERRPGDFAQAMMDLGATICTPRKPACVLCPFNGACLAAMQGDAETYPRKMAKAERPVRYGAAFLVRDAAGRLLVRTRPPKGLLGGMTEVPTTVWSADFPREKALLHAPLAANWKKLVAPVEHGFTHFPLVLDVYVAQLPSATSAPPGMRWIEPGEIAGEAFPTVFRKVVQAA